MGVEGLERLISCLQVSPIVIYHKPIRSVLPPGFGQKFDFQPGLILNIIDHCWHVKTKLKNRQQYFDVVFIDLLTHTKTFRNFAKLCP